MNLPNFLTALRIILAPVSVMFLFLDIPHTELYAAGIFILAGLTDGLDGYAARIRREITAFGKSFDPLADKILVLFALLSLMKLGLVAWWVVAIIILREVFVTILRWFAGRAGLSVGASSLGKIKTFTQILAIPALILKLPIANILLYIAVFFTILSGAQYAILWGGALSRKAAEKKQAA
ncbi:MAG TPA: CDP-diacylglycerol--glycerol-3-phosphate 3-phosphatidyltransferase [Firmicutes bacterium]|jgi:CDP-diacylglycerol--glycerol-3-phosphate 3-phosphatidyltransferase|nr:CDP-diacylglycerol--glycerol-3-phosphate 3-phosphatidyltransferase [Bacillota bacterium]HOQ23189.1 CDP-diacylglycerol--glycerol-3-phosphate 3-phosphatidyltransferase [Bacillota bacterium]HPT66618.1 CDP-diacylglycerol--glycerol-3-phosphate 3-phosphatidyltransferase [Bacillota bacterium]